MPRFVAWLLMAAAPGWAAKPELRGVWVARDSLGSRDAIRAMLDNVKGANFNAVFVDVWTQGYPLWRSAVFERETGMLSDPLYGDRDVLGEVLEEAKQRGLAVVPWVEYGFVAGYSGRKAPIAEAHPEWMARRKDGSANFAWAGGTTAYWMAHANPEVQAFLLDLLGELAEGYAVPAIQFDRARYPDLDCGYDDVTKALYAADHDGADPPEDINDAEWSRWRAEALNRFCAELSKRLKKQDWRMLVTSAPVKYNYAYVNFLQDYPAWMRAHALDFVSPQLYTPATFERDLEDQIRALGGEAARLAPGVNIQGETPTPDSLVANIRLAREKGCAGVVVWYYGALVEKKALGILREQVFGETAALPWRGGS